MTVHICKGEETKVQLDTEETSSTKEKPTRNENLLLMQCNSLQSLQIHKKKTARQAIYKIPIGAKFKSNSQINKS